MKESAQPKIFNVHDDAELEALAKAYVQAAAKRNMTQTLALNVIAEIWREDIIEPAKPKPVVIKKETQKQKQFRKKAQAFLKEFPEAIYSSSRFFSEAEAKMVPTIVLETICLCKNMFEEKDSINSTDLKDYVYRHISVIFTDTIFSRREYTNRYLEYLFKALDKLWYKAPDVYVRVNGKCVRHADLSEKPVYSENYISGHTRGDSIFEVYEPSVRYGIQGSTYARKTLQLIWTVESFF